MCECRTIRTEWICVCAAKYPSMFVLFRMSIKILAILPKYCLRLTRRQTSSICRWGFQHQSWIDRCQFCLQGRDLLTHYIQFTHSPKDTYYIYARPLVTRLNSDKRFEGENYFIYSWLLFGIFWLRVYFIIIHTLPWILMMNWSKAQIHNINSIHSCESSYWRLFAFKQHYEYNNECEDCETQQQRNPYTTHS